MKKDFTKGGFYTAKISWATLLLTLTVLASFPDAYADDIDTPLASVPLISDRPSNSPLAEADRSYRLGLLLNYVRQEGPRLVPGLPDALRGPAGWAMGNLRSADDEFGVDEVSAAAGRVFPSFLMPPSSLMQPPSAEEQQAVWFVPGYHHKGFLPFNDAMLLGFNYRHDMLDERVKLNIHPYYAQNWLSSNGYWGTEVALGIGPAAGHSWGKIVVRYDNGDADLMDQARGFDMHTELAFDEHLSLSAGVRQSQESDLGNYVLLRWRVMNISGE